MGNGGGDGPNSKILSQDTGLFSFGEGEGFGGFFCFFLSKEAAAAQSEEAHGSFLPK